MVKSAMTALVIFMTVVVFAQGETAITGLQIGTTYYDPETNRFVQVRAVFPDHVVVNGFHEYYGDAANKFGSVLPISIEKARKFKEVPIIDKSEFAVFDQGVSSYKVKDENEPKVGKD